ncbi:DUF2065 domain-containing protein [Oleiagrimonas sp.]|jgi:uncharacterized protein YjeT (DUF2065 family)|uniref:DUF2065 domain-containing protein n=1 Tax=Oleiagrimonas sp. TaxID=2010330 RepID=UPI002622D7F6|nr:DUF2065 domain-containing protein [Oleiagrimonas sp.]MDA3914172.1 DUF2065 domain-containing protein [Oleiagrimonas sp.]
MPKELYAALCLMMVIEGLVLFAAPQAWQRMMREASQMDPRSLRMIGAGAMVLGLVILRLVY